MMGLLSFRLSLWLLSLTLVNCIGDSHDQAYTTAAFAANTTNKTAFIESLVSQMTVPEMVMQLYLFFADDAIGPMSNNGLYEQALHLAPDAGIGIVHDWYTLNKTQSNSLIKLNLEKSRLKIPFLHVGECLHGVGSFQQSMFPQSLAMAASWDVDMVHRVARAIGEEAASIGIRACFSPVLDVCADSRWGRCQEDWGEDHVLTTHMGVAYASGLSKNSSWSEADAVIPVMKHFAAYGAPQGGLNIAPWMGHGNRQVLQNLLMPFKAAFELGGARGVMMAYSAWDDIPSSVNPMLYNALNEWGYDGFVIADDTGMQNLQTVHDIAADPADAIAQWFNAGGMISYYDYPLGVYLNSTIDLLQNQTISLDTLKEKMSRILGVKYDLGLFSNPYIPEDMDPHALTEKHIPLTLEAAHKSIVLMENRNSTLPLDPQSRNKIALIGPFADAVNYGDYSGQFGEAPVAHSTTLRQGILNSLANSSTKLVTAWGANEWLFNAQYAIPGYHLSTPNGTSGGLHATYFATPNFTVPLVNKTEVPVRDWGLYPPPGLPSNNFSAIWEGTLNVPVDVSTQGWLGVGISWNATANLYVDDKLLVNVPLTTSGNLLSNIPPYSYSVVNSTSAPPGSSSFTFEPGAKHKIRLEFQSWNLYQKIANQNSLNAEVLLFWNLVSPSTNAVDQAVSLARDADTIVLSLGANWNSDGENGDRATMGLAANQSVLAKAILSLNKPTILVLNGGRPFAIPDIYNHTSTAAVLSTWFGGQSGGQAVADVLFGQFNPGGRLPLTVPQDVGQMPVYYNYMPSAHVAQYVDMQSSPMYPFGHGLSYSNFTSSAFTSPVSTFPPNTSTISFTLQLKNTGAMTGSYTPQIYLLGRVSSITQPVKQLVAFTRVYLEPGESRQVQLDVDVQRFLRILNRKNQWEVEKGHYTFALLENGGMFADTGANVTLTCK